MAKLTLFLPTISISVLIFLLYSGGPLKMACGERTWCLANPMSSDAALAANIDYACSQIDCHLIQPGGACFLPDTRMHHASFAMNLYYQTMGRHKWDCDFRNSAVVSLTDPSFGNCSFESGGAVLEGEEPSGTWCVAKPGTRGSILQQNINYACSQVDCSAIQEGGACFYPTTLRSHASYAMNLYYRTTGCNKSGCDFKNTGLIVSYDPSYGNCSYQIPAVQH